MLTRPTPSPPHGPPSSFAFARFLILQSRLVRVSVEELGLGFHIYKMGSPIIPTSSG